MLRRDVTDDNEVSRNWDFPFIHRAIDSDSGCLEASVRMVYCATFDCIPNISKNRVTCSWRKFPAELTLFKQANFKSTKHSRLRENLFRLRSGHERMVALD